MRKRFPLLIFTIVIAVYTTSSGQNKSNFNSEILDLGVGKIISSTLKESGDYVIQEFIVEVEKTGSYYMAAWVNSTLDLSGEMLKYSFAVNDTKEEDNFWTAKSHPHAVDFGEKMVDLNAGSNKIYFKTRKPFCPNIEFIKVSQYKQSSQISGEKYDQYIAEISKENLPDNYTEIKEAAMAEELASARLKSAPNPQVNYDYELDEDFGYTYYINIWLSSGTVTLETKGATSDPVMHLFFFGEPTLYTWTNDDGGLGYNSKIVASITESGLYTILIRKKSTSVAGTCSLYKNSTRLSSTCAVSGSPIQCNKTVSSGLNWFTADLSGDSHIWLEDQTGNPGKIIQYNDDWNVSSDFSWGNNARIREYVSTNVRALILSSHSSWNPTGNCDVYMNCRNSSGPVSKPLDAIQSALSSTNYNCFSWSGGRTDLGRYFTPDQYDSPWKSSNELNSFDNFYGNRDDDGEVVVRYTSQIVMNFSRDEATASNACVALWSSSPNSFEHASVKKPANEQPHGYDWESKDGSLDRFFHPKDALTGYNTIQRYYKFSGWSSGTQPEMKSENVQITTDLTDDDSDLLSRMADTFLDKARFEKLYESWKDTWDDPELVNQNNCKMFAKNEQYSSLLYYCQNQSKEVWPLIFNKYVDGEELSMLLIADVTKDEYSWLMEEIRKQQNRECSRKRYPPSQRVNGLNYISALLKEVDKLKSDPITDVLSFDIDQSVNLYPNPAKDVVNIVIAGVQQTELVIKIYDLSGKVLKSVTKHMKGDHTGYINIGDIPNGTYILKIESNSNVYITKLNVIK